jgi:pimeloyl-ACP methyl ester carboxylesterase
MRRVLQAARGGAEATVEDALRRWFTATFSASHPQVLDEIRRWIVANDRDVYPAVYRLLAEGDIGLEEAISDIDCPVLVLTGEKDLGNSPQMAAGMCALMPRSRCVVLPGLKHMAPIEDPRAVNASLLPFLIDNASR